MQIQDRIERVGFSEITKDQQTMVEHTDVHIRDRAYKLWKDEGCVEGKDMDFWLKAEREILGEMPTTPPSKPAAKKPAAAKPKATPKPKAAPKPRAAAKPKAAPAGKR